MIRLLKPSYYYKNIFSIELDKLIESNIEGIICDIDNTIVPWSEERVLGETFNWFEKIKRMEFKVCLVSNGIDNRASFFGERLDLPYVGMAKKPVLIKRGLSATIEEWLMAAEYVISEGNPNIILCERGIRTFETATRNTLDLSSIPVIKENSHLPIIVDPSHASGTWKYVNALSKGAVATGADGLIIEVHSNPALALSDGPQSLRPLKFANLMEEIKLVAQAVNRTI